MTTTKSQRLQQVTGRPAQTARTKPPRRPERSQWPNAGITLGVGFSSKASAQDIVEAIDAALDERDITQVQLTSLATMDIKRGSLALADAAQQLGLTVTYIGAPALHAVAARCLTQSHLSLEATGLPSASEAAALAAAGPDARLLAPRFAVGLVTCALASPHIQNQPGGTAPVNAKTTT